MPPLANYLPIKDYAPLYGDVYVWAGWFSTWFGVAADFSAKTGSIEIIFGGLPFLLLTMPEADYLRNTRNIALSDIQNSSPGTWAVLRHDPQRNVLIWYI